MKLSKAIARWLRGGSALLALSLPLAAAAQPAAAAQTDSPGFWAGLDALGWLLLLAAGALALITFALLFTVLLLVNHLVKLQLGYSPLARLFAGLPKPGFLSWSRLMALRPAKGKEAAFDQDLGHDYDGITELDNAAPPIFNYIFYGTIGFAAIYLFAFWGLGSNTLRMHWEYAQELKLAAAQQAERAKSAANAVDETTVTLVSDPAVLASGQQVYLANCQACHGAEGQGGVGPNLTDEYWLHGGNIGAVFHTVKVGVPDKGMVAWQAQLSPSQIAAVSNYIMSLRGSNPANGKAPQGARYVEEAVEGAAAGPPAAVPDSSQTAITRR